MTGQQPELTREYAIRLPNGDLFPRSVPASIAGLATTAPRERHRSMRCVPSPAHRAVHQLSDTQKRFVAGADLRRTKPTNR